MYRFVSFILAVALTTGLIVTPVYAADTAPFQIVRAGDHALTCAALAGEINSLAMADVPPAAEAPKKKRGGFGLGRLLGSVAPLVPGVGGVVGGVVMAAASTAQQGAAQDSVADMTSESRAMMRRAMAGPSPESQRKDRLTAIFEEKRC